MPSLITPQPRSIVAVSAVSPRTSTIFDVPVLTRQKSVRLASGGPVELLWTMVDDRGIPVDLTAAAAGDWSSFVDGSSLGVNDVPPRVALRTRETISLGQPSLEFAGEFVAPGLGTIRIRDFDPRRLGGPGIFLAEWAIVAPDNTTVLANQFQLLVEDSLFGPLSPTGPPSIAEIRLRMRDSSSVEHELIDTVAFDDAEIALALREPVEYWNETGLDLGRYTTSTFPYRYNWKDAACAVLYRLMAQFMRDNQFAQQAAGMTIDDMNKAPQFDAAADKLWAQWQQFVVLKKGELNRAAFWGRVGGYGRGYF